MKRIALTLLVLIVIGLIGWQVVQQVKSAGTTGPGRQGRAPTPVEIQPVTRQTIRDTGLFTGSLYPISKFTVAAKTGGRLEKLNVHIGDAVSAHALIAELEDDEYRQQTEQADAELKVAQANLEESRIALDAAARELERAKSLRATRIASESELEAAQTQYHAQEAKNKVALAQVDQKAAMLKAAEIRSAYTRIRLPDSANGEKWLVGERFVDEGALLAANSPIVSVLNISRLTAVIYVIERDYPKMRIGRPAEISTDAFPGRIFQGSIVRIAPELKESSREARVEVEIPNPDQTLKPGMFVRVQIELATRENALVVPESAIVKRDNKPGVFIADMEKQIARFVPVTIGIISGDTAQIIEPDLTGNIVTLGQHLLEDGAPILMTNAEKQIGHPPSTADAVPTH